MWTPGAFIWRIKVLNLSVENLRRREEAGMQCDFSFDLKEDQKAILAGNLALDAKLRYYAPHLTFRQISLTVTPLGGLLPKEAGPAQLVCEGALNLQTQSLRLATARLSTPQARLTLGGEATLTPQAFKGTVSLEGSPRKLAALTRADAQALGQRRAELQKRSGIRGRHPASAPDRHAAGRYSGARRPEPGPGHTLGHIPAASRPV